LNVFGFEQISEFKQISTLTGKKREEEKKPRQTWPVQSKES
jgi:hypothetical protein